STHTNCLIQFVKERLVKSFSSQPRRAFYAFLICCQAFIFEVFYHRFLSKANNFNNLPLAPKRSSLRGGE
ncbi:hypothetical protein ACIP02_08185, partial [Pseudomonas sp. NPDC089408]|uniref:hypothetical protein n=1 Tax=Pseudomonas sp. NPDC089408 TaxID=3364465 RepID=UPI0037FF18B8